MNTVQELIAVKGKMANVRLTAGQATHLAANNDRTLCGLLVRNKINHISPLRYVVSCKHCTKAASRYYPGWNR